ncbi:unnamed protein product [Sphagnum jensenii]|uniref:Cation-transporting P-type ATPase N-terminal domain-containing protein n=1 Tax=Sphagnum jensenii TaxID=128206 RepID=A0ABP0VAT5_9BRYO
MIQIQPEYINGVSQSTLNNINIEQDKHGNFEYLRSLGGIEALANTLGVNTVHGLTKAQVEDIRAVFGKNEIPASPKRYFLFMLFEALTDPTLLVLIAAAIVSLVIGVVDTSQQDGWIEGVAIFIAIILVSLITTSNDYSKELQFRALERSSQQDDSASVFRDGRTRLIKTQELVVGDIVRLHPGDMVPADCVLLSNSTVMCNESALTGESDDVPKSAELDPFLLSSCLVTECDGDVRAIVIGVGIHSQWGKIKASLVVEPVNTPLQDKLEVMTTQNESVAQGLIDAFILAVTIVVVAIPEGLPLAVAISLAYSTKKMYREKCFIRVLAACETMGNATNICCDKTGTLTQNMMTVVQGWIADCYMDKTQFHQIATENVVNVICENVGINRTAYYISKRPALSSCGFEQSSVNLSIRGQNHDALVLGSKTEASLMAMISQWGMDADVVKAHHFDARRDKIFAFDSKKKRSTAVVFRPDGSVRLYCKGASEYLLKSCDMYLDCNENPERLTIYKRDELEQIIYTMASQALRTLLLAHKDFADASMLPTDWKTSPPDSYGLCCDAIVGIVDPIRPDVVEAVQTAQMLALSFAWSLVTIWVQLQPSLGSAVYWTKKGLAWKDLHLDVCLQVA